MPAAGDNVNGQEFELARCSTDRVWALVDTGNAKSLPSSIALAPSVFTVQTAPPDPTRFKAWVQVRLSLAFLEKQVHSIHFSGKRRACIHHEPLGLA